MQGCWFYWLCWSPHFISPSVPLTCQHQSCCCWGTKPSWWITPLPHRTSTFPPLFSSISILYAQIWRGGAKSRKITFLCHHSYSWVCCCLICWVCFSVGLNLIFIIPLPSSSTLPSPLFTSLTLPPIHNPFLSSRFLISEVIWGKRQDWFGKFLWVIVFLNIFFSFYIISTFIIMSVFVSDLVCKDFTGRLCTRNLQSFLIQKTLHFWKQKCFINCIFALKTWNKKTKT